ncbi:MAG: MFS transporter [Candidatus Hodarchaeales archaeon]|jgi:MFS family permease
MKITEFFFIILPTTIVWIVTAPFLLVYAFDLLQIDTQSLFSPGVVILFITTFFATISLFSTGYVIDKEPHLLKPLITVSLLMSGFSLFLTVLGIDSIVFLLIGLPSLGIFLGILATGSGALYTAYTEIHHRGRIYASALFISAILSLILILYVESFHLDIRIPVIIIGTLAILNAIIFYYISRSVEPWKNDKFPTPIREIINRRPVKAYLIAHFFIYLMLGIAFVSISQIGNSYLNLIINIPIFGEMQFGQTKVFWFFVFFGDLICVLPMGWFSDRFGRKNLIVMGFYGIVIAALIVGLTDSLIGFYISAFLIGASFSTMHPTLDSAVWCDLSPLDSIGRYNALSFIFLLQGVGFGLVIGLFILTSASTSAIIYLLFGSAVLGLLPLFFVADSYEPLDIYLLLIATSGMCMFDYDFNRQSKITQKDLALVAGALSAISTFFEGIGEEYAALDLVRHGRVITVQAKAGTEEKQLIATVFANKIDPELRSSLETFLARFCLSYHDEINEWVGQLEIFDPAVSIAEDVFGPLIPSKTILGNLNES